MTASKLTSSIYILAIFAGMFTYKFSSLYMGIACFAFCLMSGGLFLKPRAPKAHAFSMSLAMIIDIILVLTLELTRGAVMATVTNDYNFWNYTHFATSTIAVTLYPFTFYYGLKRLRGLASPKQKTRHRQFALATYAFRTLGFFTMFSLLEKISSQV